MSRADTEACIAEGHWTLDAATHYGAGHLILSRILVQS